MPKIHIKDRVAETFHYEHVLMMCGWVMYWDAGNFVEADTFRTLPLRLEFFCKRCVYETRDRRNNNGNLGQRGTGGTPAKVG